MKLRTQSIFLLHNRQGFEQTKYILNIYLDQKITQSKYRLLLRRSAMYYVT